MAGLVSSSLPDIEDPNKLGMSGVTYEPERVQFDPGTDTVAGRVDSIIKANSGSMQAVAGRSNQAMQARGLLNSSIAVGEGQKALYDAAIPMATTDAQLSLNTKLANAAAGNTAAQLGATGAQQLGVLGAQGDIQSKLQQERGQIDLQLQSADAATREKLLNRQAEIDKQLQASGGDIQSKLQAEKGAIDLQLVNADAATRAALLERQGQIDTQLQNLRGTQAIDLQKLSGQQQTAIAALDNNYRSLLQASASASETYANAMASISAIMAEPTLTNEAKQPLIDQQVAMLNSGLALIGAIHNIDFGSLLTSVGGTTPPLTGYVPPAQIPQETWGGLTAEQQAALQNVLAGIGNLNLP
jgi:hypothetical protein